MGASLRLPVATVLVIASSFFLTVTQGSCGSGSSNTDPYVHVQFVTPSTGWIVGSRLLQTTDGGKSWRVIDKGGDGTIRSETIVDDLRRFQFINPDVGITWRGNVFKRTTDSGRTWAESFSIPPPNEYQLLAFYFLNAMEGWAAGRNVYYTDNGGRSWQQLAPTPTGDYQHQRRIRIDPESANYWPLLRFTTSKDGVMAKLDGMVFLTHDGGKSWQYVFEANTRLSDLFFSDNLDGWLVGNGGFVARTRDGGQTWVPIKTPANNDLIAVHFVNSNVGCAVGSKSTIVCTKDGGTTWTSASVKSLPATLPLLVSVSFADELNGWAVGGFGIESSSVLFPSSSNIVLTTKDGGLSWEPVNLSD